MKKIFITSLSLVLLSGIKLESRASTAVMGVLGAAYKAGSWSVQQYKNGLHCKTLCNAYTCGRGAVTSEKNGTQGVLKSIAAAFKGNPQEASANLSKSEKSLGAFCKKTCQWTENFEVVGDQYVIKKRFDDENGWNLRACVAAYNTEIEDKTGSRGAKLNSLAVYNQEDYERLKKAMETQDLMEITAYFQESIAVQ